MSKLLVAAIVVAVGIFGYFHYKQVGEEAEVARVAPLPPAPPPPPPRSLEERAAAAQGTVYPVQKPDPPPRVGEVETVQRASEPAAEGPVGFRCDGRQYCSQMHSCKEATWFVQHCPTTKMDGDADGIPCETQWCN